MPQASDHSTLIFIVQVALLMIVARFLGELMQRIRQPAMMGQLLAGVLLGRTGLGVLWPDAYRAVFPDSAQQTHMLNAVSELGVLLLLLLTGMETDLGLVNRTRRTALLVSVSGILFPFASGFALGEALPAALLPDPARRLATALFLAVALSISSVKIVAAVIRELDFLRRTLGQVIIGAAMLDDTVGWVILAVVAGLAVHGRIDPTTVGVSLLGTILFLIVSFTVGKAFVGFVIRWANDTLVMEAPVITVILAIAFGGSVLTASIGVHTVLGAFVAGVLIGQSPILVGRIQDELRGLITGFFMPVFFATAGLGANLAILRNLELAGLTAGFILIASLGKLAGGYTGGRLSGLSGREATALAVGMNARGSTEVIVATIGLSLAVLSRDLFTMIVVMAIATTLIMPPTLRWAISRIPLSEEEEARFEQQRADAGAFLPGLERVLVVTDLSAHGQFASRLAGLLVGSRRVMTTVLEVRAHAREEARGQDRSTGDIVKAEAGRAAGTSAAHDAQEMPRVPVSVVNQAHDSSVPEAVAQEIRKGYGFLLLGSADPLLRDAGGAAFRSDIEEVARTFEGAMGIVIAAGGHLRAPLGAPLRILVLVTGTDYSRRAAEVALAIGGTAGAPMTALYVSPDKPAGVRPRRMTPDPHEMDILKDIQQLADRQGVELRTFLISGGTPEEAVARAIRRERHTLVVIGVKTRPGERLYFGHTSAALQERMLCSLLLVRT